MPLDQVLLGLWNEAIKYIDEIDSAVLAASPDARWKPVPGVWKPLRDISLVHLKEVIIDPSSQLILKKWVDYHKLNKTPVNKELTLEQAIKFTGEIVDSSRQLTE